MRTTIINSRIAVVLIATLGLALTCRSQILGEAYTADQLDQLLGPIALYPDPLLAVILPASTVPSDIELAANYLAANGDPNAADAQPWDASVKALAHYPDVVKWMNANIEWTQALGAAFAQQPADVMKSVQQLRAQARAAGTLVNTPQQQVVLEGDDIRIVPALPDTIYVPEYDPAIVYERPVGYAGPFISFGAGFPVGAWLGFECDWDNFGIWVGPWSPGWAYRRPWRQPGFGGNWRAWRPDPIHSRQLVRNYYRPEIRLPRPGGIAVHRTPIRRQPSEAPRPATPREPSRPDYRGRTSDAPRPSPPAPSGQLFNGYERGTRARDFSNRGQASRSAPVRTPPPSRASPPSREPGPARERR